MFEQTVSRLAHQMIRIQKASLYLFALAAICVSCSETPTPSVESRVTPDEPAQNVILITIDTLRGDYLGCYGRAEVSTPNIDGLAARGARFDQAIVQIPLTTPSHASILTGTYPQVHKIRDIGGFTLAKNVPTMASIAKAAGYETAAFVAAAVLNRRYGLDKGFDVYNDDMAGSVDSEKLPGVVAEVRADVVSGRAIDWLSKRKDPTRPFLLWVHYYDPHFPYDPPAPYSSQYSGDPYGGEVAYTDGEIGRLLDKVDELELREQTLVVLTSDHGESLGDHGEETHGVFLYDSTMKVPLIVAGPGIPSNRVVDQQVRSIDLMPTVVDFLNLTEGEQVQGVSLIPLFGEQGRVRSNYCYMETLYPRTQMRWSELRGMRTDDWKLVIAPQPELFEMKADPIESENVLSRYPTEADRLQKQVWEINGPPDTWGKIEYQPMDAETLEELQSLGYVSAGGSRELLIDVSGPDPKDMVPVLQGLDKATDLMNDDQFSAAVPVLRKLIELDSTNPLIYQHLGVCLQDGGRFDEARRLYLLAIENGVETDRIYAELGEVNIRMGRLEAGTEALRHSIELNPANLDNFANLANAYLQLGRFDDADDAIKAILAQKRTHAGAHKLQGLLYISKRQPMLARKSFEEAVEYDPDLVEPYMNLGLLAQLAGQRGEAIRYFKLFLEKATDERFRETVPKVQAAVRELESGR
jgi:arylsulfatase A-like enzyme/Flp pilus assembly protein TadD